MKYIVTVSVALMLNYQLLKILIKVTEQDCGCVAENHPHGRVILQKCLNLYIILKLTEPNMMWKCFSLVKLNIKCTAVGKCKMKQFL